MAPQDIKEIEELFERKFMHHKANIDTALSGMYSELARFSETLKNHKGEAAQSQRAVIHANDEINRKVDLILVELQGTKLDPERGFIHRLKRLEAAIEILKTDKQFLKGGWWLAVKLLAIITGGASFFILIYKFLKEAFVK